MKIVVILIKMPKKKAIAKKTANAQLGAIELFSESIKATFDLRFFAIAGIALALGFVALIPLIIVVVLFGIAVFIALQSPAIALALFLAAIIIVIAIFIIATAIIDCFYIKSVDQYLKTKRFSLEENLKLGFRKWKTLSAVVLLQAIIALAIAAVTILPVIVIVISKLPEITRALAPAILAENPLEILQALMPVLPTIVIGLIAFAVINLLIRPLLFLWFPAAVLEEKQAAQCIGKGYAIGKKRYLRNLGALFLMTLVSIILAGVSSLDRTSVIGMAVSLWLGLASIALAVKAYREG